MNLTSSLAAYLLGEAYAAATGERPTPFIPKHLRWLAKPLDENPELLEAAWTIWNWEMDSWSEAKIMDARRWVDKVLISGLPVSE